MILGGAQDTIARWSIDVDIGSSTQVPQAVGQRMGE